MNYVAPWWLPGGNSQTIWAALRARRFLGSAPVFRRERWSTPDSDFVDVDWLVSNSEGAPERRAGPPQASSAPSGGSVVREATSEGAPERRAGPPQASLAPSGGSVVREATSEGAPERRAGPPQASSAPSGGSAVREATSVGAPPL